MAFTLVDLSGGVGAGGGGEIVINLELQEKTVDSSSNIQHVKPTDGYIGLKEVTVNPVTSQNKTVDSSTVSQEIVPDAGVTCLNKVTVNPYVLDEKTVDSSTVAQEVTSDADGLSKVTINPYVLGSLAVNSSTAVQEFTGQYGTVTVNPYVLDSSTVDSSTNSQTLIGQFGEVTINPYVLDSSTLVATQNGEFVITSSADGLSRVNVSVNIDTQSYYDEGYSNGESAGIAEQKAKLDSSTFTANGTYTREDGWNEITVDIDTINNQNKTVDSSTKSQIVSPDQGYTGLGQVIVNPYTLDSSTLEITTNGQYTVTSTADGLSRVDVSVGIDTQSYYDSGYSAGETAGIAEGIAEQKAKLDSSTFTENGTYTREDGWNEITVEVPIPTFTTQSKTVDSSTNSQEVEPDSGYNGLSKVTVNPYVLDSSTVDPSTNQITVTSAEDGLSSVTVNAVTSSIDVNIAAGNIKDGVTILGVTGNYTGAIINNQNKTVDASTNSQTVTYDSGYTGLETVTVNPYTLTTGSIDSSTAAQTVSVPAGYNGLSSVTISGLNLDNIYNTLAAY